MKLNEVYVNVDELRDLVENQGKRLLVESSIKYVCNDKDDPSKYYYYLDIDLDRFLSCFKNELREVRFLVAVYEATVFIGV